MPVRVTLRGDGQDRKVRLHLRGEPMVHATVELPRNTVKRLFLYTTQNAQLVSGGPELDLVVDGRVVQTTELEFTRLREQLIPVIGGPALQVGSKIKGPVVDPAALPDRVAGYDGLQALFIYPEAWAEIPDAPMAALKQWVFEGGVIVAPLRWRSSVVSLDDDHPFGPLRPGASRELFGVYRAVRRYLEVNKGDEPLETWDRLGVVDLPRDPKDRTAFTLEVRIGSREAPETEYALASRRRFGGGNVCLLAFEPLTGNVRSAEWRPTWEPFLASILKGSAPSKKFAALRPAPRSWPEAEPAYKDLRELVLAREAEGASLGWFLLALLGYLALLGPVDYWLVKKIGRPRWTWITFPTIVVVFCLFAWAAGRTRISLFESREFTFVDYVRSGGPGIARGYVGVYSDTNSTYTLTPLPRAAQVRRLEGGDYDSIVYVRDRNVESLKQKMLIWSYHGYRVVWEEKESTVRARWADADRTELDLRVELANGAPPASSPLLFLIRGGQYYPLEPAADGGPEGRMRIGAAALELSTVQAACNTVLDSRVTTSFLDGPHAGVRRDPRADLVVAVIPEPWGVLEVAERRGIGGRGGFSVLRAPVAAPLQQ